MTSISEYNDMLSTVEQVFQLLTKALEQFDLSLEQEMRAYKNRRGMSSYSQCTRSIKMRKARTTARTAMETMQSAFDLIPEGCLVRQRYPEETADLSIPDISGMKTGSLWETMKLRIKENVEANLEIIKESQVICQEQLDLVGTLKRSIRTEMQQQEQE